MVNRQVIVRSGRKLVFILISVIGATAVIFLLYQIFSVSVIEVRGSKGIKGLSVLKKRPIFLVNEEEEEKRLGRLNSQLAKVSVKRKLPNKLVIEVLVEQPIAIFKASDGFFYLSVNGKVLQREKGKVNHHQLPVMSYYQKFSLAEYSIGDVLSTQDIQYGLFFINSLQNLGVSVERVDISGFDMIVLNTVEGKSHYFTTVKDKSSQLAQFKIIYKRFTIEKTDYKSIDLRFDKPVVRFK